jgi:fibronectin type 3 domain-containing protein
VSLFLLAVACGKVADPKPPVNRTPLAASDVSAGQSGNSVTLSWTNPALYIDSKTAVTDLGFVRILRNGTEIAREKAGMPGQRQSYTIPDVSNDLNAEWTFEVQIETSRGRMSTLSNPVQIRTRDIPGVPVDLVAKVDERRIILDWKPPQRNPELANVYLVTREDRPAPVTVVTNHYEDEDYESDKSYKYTVTAARTGDSLVTGASGASVSVVAKDESRPVAPTGLTVAAGGPGLVLIKWDRNKERDVKEYRVYRSDKGDSPLFTTNVDGGTDPNYQSGLTYRVQAVDESGNPSPLSDPKAGP